MYSIYGSILAKEDTICAVNIEWQRPLKKKQLQLP